jgi:membrane protein required for colicin V production
MNFLDWAAVLIFFGSCLLGFLRGGAKEIVGFGGWIRGFVVSFFFAALLSPLLANLVANSMMRWFAAFSILFIVERMLSYALALVLTELVKAAHLDGLNKMIGLFLGIVRGTALILLITVLCMTTLVPTTEPWKNSLIAPIAQKLAMTLTPFFAKDLPPFIKQKESYRASESF